MSPNVLHLVISLSLIVAAMCLGVAGLVAAADPEGRGGALSARLAGGALVAVLAAASAWFL